MSLQQAAAPVFIVIAAINTATRIALMLRYSPAPEKDWVSCPDWHFLRWFVQKTPELTQINNDCQCLLFTTPLVITTEKARHTFKSKNNPTNTAELQAIDTVLFCNKQDIKTSSSGKGNTISSRLMWFCSIQQTGLLNKLLSFFSMIWCHLKQ